ncbi:toxin glutamine deamidase domain-containing protein [Nocardia aurantiaca]|uniref:Uncharacterized protein n=1 Tax=Nocardia aurantiaca TaxID=2675850 RepID=A0A6I3KQG5_9NOCA|nr:toxin glutamine deamidase domain-containing protein [Nocardia aurantiaca]MTE11561.1 hypothetical protein [Nocardia aurantiaca]
MSWLTAGGDHLPGWLMQALNFGQAYPKGDEEALFSLGDAWNKAASQLENLEPELRSVTGKVPQYYVGDGATKISEEFATLFDGKDYSIQKLVSNLHSLGHDTRSTATTIEYTKIQEEAFALLTLWTVGSLMVSLYGEVLVPAYLAIAREGLAVFAESMMKRIAALASRAALESMAKPLSKEIVVPLGQRLAPVALQIGKSAVIAAGMGAGLDAGIQAIQLGMGHRDDGFDLKQTFTTGIEWGVGGLVGGPGHMLADKALKRTLPGLTPRLGGFVSGGIGGVAGAFGMYGAGLGVQYYDKGNWHDVDKSLSPQMLAGGLAMGGLGGMKAAGKEHGGVPSTGDPSGSLAKGFPAEAQTKLTPDTNPAHESPAAASDARAHENEQPAKADLATDTEHRAAPTNTTPQAVDQPRSGPVDHNRPADTTSRTTDATGRSADTGAKVADSAAKQTAASDRPAEPITSKDNTPARPPADSPARTANVAPAEQKANLVAGAQDKAAPAPAARAQEVRAPESEVRPLRAEPTAQPTATRPTDVAPTRTNVPTDGGAADRATPGDTAARIDRPEPITDRSPIDTMLDTPDEPAQRPADPRGGQPPDPGTQPLGGDHQAPKEDPSAVGSDHSSLHDKPQPNAPALIVTTAPHPGSEHPLEVRRRIDKVTGVERDPELAKARQEFEDFYKEQNTEAAKPTHVTPRDGGSPTAATGYEVRRFSYGPGEKLTTLTVKVHLEQIGTVPPEHLREIADQLHSTADRVFNTGERLLSGDRLHVELEFVDDPADAHLKASVGNPHEIVDPTVWNHETPTDVLAERLRDHLGLSTDTVGDHTLDDIDVRRISNDIAIANTEGRVAGLPETRVIAELHLDDLEFPEHQWAVEDALRDGDRFLVHADPRTNPYGDLINDGGPHETGRSNNCLDNSLAALSSFLGDPQVAHPRWPDLLVDGTIDGWGPEQGGNDRALHWLGGDFSTWGYNHPTVSVPEQFSWLHDHMSQLGEGSAALVVNSWSGGGAHATVIVYPKGASGPLWWDPQQRTISEAPPHSLTNQSTGVWFVALDPNAPNGGVTGAGAVPHTGPSGGVPGPHLPTGPEIQHLPDGLRLGLSPETLGGAHPSGEPTADSGPSQLGGQRSDGSGDHSPEPAPDNDRPPVRRSDSDGPTGTGRADLPPSLDSDAPANTGDRPGDRIPGDRVVSERAPGADTRTPVDHQQEGTAAPHEPAERPGAISTSDGLGTEAVASKPDLAGAGDPRVLDGVDPGERPEPAAEHPAQANPHLGDRLLELEALSNQIDRAATYSEYAHELPGLRRDMADLLDHLGMRDRSTWETPWRLLSEHDPAFARKLADQYRDLPPERKTDERAGTPLEPSDARPADQNEAHGNPDRPSTLTQHLKDRFEQIRERINDIFAAHQDPARTPELPELRAKFGDLVDELGLRDREAWVTAWDLFREHDATLAQYVEQNHEYLLPRPEDLAQTHVSPGTEPSGHEPAEQPHTEQPHTEDSAAKHHPEPKNTHPTDEPHFGDPDAQPHNKIPEVGAESALTSDEHYAVHRYTDPDADVFSDLNHRLRNGIELDPEQRKLAGDLASGLDKLLVHDGTVWRGAHLTPEQIARYVPGAKITEPSFISSSRDLRRIFTSNVEFIIHSETGRDISAISARPGEQEVLFKPGTTFEVRGAVQDPHAGLFGRTRVYLYESTEPAPVHEAPTERKGHEGRPSEHASVPGADVYSTAELPVRHGTDRTALGDSPEAQRVFENVRNEGEHDVVVHGGRFGKPTGDGGFEIDPQHVVDAIRSNPDYVEGTPVRLLSCHSGNEIGWAQHIADELGVPVRAPSDLVGVRAVPNSPAVIHDTGEWRTFHPSEADGTTPEPAVQKPTEQTDGRLPKYEEDPRENWDILGNDRPGDEKTPPPDRTTEDRTDTGPAEHDSPPSAQIDRPANDRTGEHGYPRATLDDLGFPDGEGIALVDLPRIEQALAVTELVPTEEVRFTQRSVSRETSDGIPIQELADHMADGGWRGGPIHAVVAEDGHIISLDNRRLTAAQMARLDRVPTALHSPNDRLADWPHEWDESRRERNPLRVDIRQLPDGTLRVGGDAGEIVYRRGQVAETWGEIALFRSAEQRSLLPGDLAGSDQRPVFAAKPAPAIEIDLPPADHQAIADAVGAARPEADQILSDLHSTLDNVNRDLDLVRDPVETWGEDHRVKSEESLARKFQTERSAGENIDSFLNRVNDLVRFSTRLPDGEGYRPALDAVLSGLEERGYEVVDVKNFWKEDNRYLGLNATLRSPHGREFELQFPTDTAWRANKLTHEPYEVFRRTNEPTPEPIERRVHSFFEILRTNEELGLNERIPGGVEERWSPMDSGLAKWVRKNPDHWRLYEDWLHENNRDLRWVTDQFGLDLDKHLPGYKTEEHENRIDAPGLPEADTDGPIQPDSGRTGPAPELTPEQRAQHWQHLDQVEARNPDEFDHLQRDPDKNGGISEPSKDEARVGLDLREQGRLPQDIRRPDQADHGEFHSQSNGKYYDIKGVHSDWPPFNNVRDKSKPFKGAYNPAKNSRWVDKLREQIEEKNRTVIIDLRNADQAAIDDIELIVRTHGWDDDVIWYP